MGKLLAGIVSLLLAQSAFGENQLFSYEGFLKEHNADSRIRSEAAFRDYANWIRSKLTLMPLSTLQTLVQNNPSLGDQIVFDSPEMALKGPRTLLGMASTLCHEDFGADENLAKFQLLVKNANKNLTINFPNSDTAAQTTSQFIQEYADRYKVWLQSPAAFACVNDEASSGEIGFLYYTDANGGTMSMGGEVGTRESRCLESLAEERSRVEGLITRCQSYSQISRKRQVSNTPNFPTNGKEIDIRGLKIYFLKTNTQACIESEKEMLVSSLRIAMNREKQALQGQRGLLYFFPSGQSSCQMETYVYIPSTFDLDSLSLDENLDASLSGALK